MAKSLYNAMGYRTVMPDDAGITGCQLMQFVNTGFYKKDAAGNDLYEVEPNWTTDVANTLAKVDRRKAVYFDLEAWLDDYPKGQSDILKLNQKLWTGTILSQYAAKSSGSSPPGLTTLFGFPQQDYSPLNTTAELNGWKSYATAQLSGGELSSLIMNNIDCLTPVLYPSNFSGKDYPLGDFPLQITYNQIIIDLMKANNPRKLPLIAFFQPRYPYVRDGKRHLLDYQTAFLHADWILSHCDGMILFDWDGYGDPDIGQSVIAWNDTITKPWYKAVKDAWANATRTPVYVTTTVTSHGFRH